jgi:hypothetical protein
MSHAPNLDGVGIWADEEEAVVAYTQAKLVSSLDSFHVAHARLCKTEERREDLHRDRPAQAANITFGWVSPDNPLHFGSR